MLRWLVQLGIIGLLIGLGAFAVKLLVASGASRAVAVGAVVLVAAPLGAVMLSRYVPPPGPPINDVTTDLANRNELFVAAARAFVDRPLEFRIEGSIRFSSASYAFESRSKELLAGSTFARRTAQAPLLSLDEQASRVYELSPGVPVAQVVLLASNPGDIGYFLHGKELTLMLGGWPVAVEDMSPVPIAAGDTTRVDLLFYPATSSLNEESSAALRAAMDGYATLMRIEGELFMDVLGVDSFPVPTGWSVTGFVH